MFVNADSFNKTKNKWKSQQIHKKHNQIQYCSKHYGKNDNNDIIFKTKHPLKQRRDRKKFKIQRQRKKIYKQMAFDFHDFIFKNKNENYKTIQIRPKMHYQYNIDYNIKSIYNNYYYPSIIHDQQDANNIDELTERINKSQTNINGVIINTKLYAIPINVKNYKWSCPKCTLLIQSTTNERCCLCGQPKPKHMEYSYTSIDQYRLMNYADITIKPITIHENNDNLPITNTYQLLSDIPDFNDNQTKFKNNYSFNRIGTDLWIQIANKVLKSYKANGTNDILCSFKGIKQEDITKNWKIADIQNNKDSITDLRDTLNCIIPDLWVIYDILFEYIGYNSLTILFSVEAKLENLNLLKQHNNVCEFKHKSTKNCNHGISYYDRSRYKRMRRYSDYIKDIQSYIPSYIYYKENNNNEFYKIGNYHRNDWNIIRYFGDIDWKMMKYFGNKTKRKKFKKQQETNCAAINSHIKMKSNCSSICWCGCKKGVNQFTKNKHIMRLKQKGVCVHKLDGKLWNQYKIIMPQTRRYHRKWWMF